MLQDEDWEYLEKCYGPNSPHPNGVGPTISFIVHNFVQKLKARTAQALDEQAQSEDSKQ